MSIKLGCDILKKYCRILIPSTCQNPTKLSDMESSSPDDIVIIPFEPRFQGEVEQLFRYGLSPKTYDYGPTIAASQKGFVASKLSKEKGGDMFNIWESYMAATHDNIISKTDSSSPQDCKYFWVALDKLNDKVVGHVGVIMSTYKPDNSFIYHSPELNSSNVCELVRMGVHSEYRGKKIGKRLCETLEKHAKEKGMKQMVLSTLERMDLARFMYEKYGFRLVHTTKIPMQQLLGPGDWEQLNVVHYVKEVEDVK